MVVLNALMNWQFVFGNNCWNYSGGCPRMLQVNLHKFGKDDYSSREPSVSSFAKSCGLKVSCPSESNLILSDLIQVYIGECTSGGRQGLFADLQFFH